MGPCLRAGSRGTLERAVSHRLERVPDRWLPAAYLVFAHLCLLTAFGAFAVDPAGLAGFFYHAKMLAVVHLITLGWITGSILGALHFVLPMALRSPLPVRRLDRWAFWSFVVGVLGMVSHFWIEEASGMVWSAALVVAAIVRVGWRVVGVLRAAPVPFEHRLPFGLAFANMLLAGLLGMLIGIDKTKPVLPGFVLDHVLAHAHLAALGWATFMVMGATYRLLPMLLPSAVPRGRPLLVSSALTEVGVLTLAGALLVGSRLVIPAGLLYVAGVGFFLVQLRWMLAHPKPPPKQLRRPDFGVAHVAAAFIYLIVTLALGAFILLRPGSAVRLQLVNAYAVVGLVGFLSQMVVGVSVRFLPLYAWMRDFAAADFDAVPSSPHARVRRGLHALTFACWTLGTPLLAIGLALPDADWMRLAGLLLSVAVATSLLHMALVLRPSEATPVEHRG